MVASYRGLEMKRAPDRREAIERSCKCLPRGVPGVFRNEDRFLGETGGRQLRERPGRTWCSGNWEERFRFYAFGVATQALLSESRPAHRSTLFETRP